MVSEKQSVLTQPWFIRKVLYGVFSILSAFMAIKGASDVGVDAAFTSLVEPIVELVSALVFAFAGIKTTEASDYKAPSPKAIDEVFEAVNSLRRMTIHKSDTIQETASTTNELLQELRERLND